MRWRVLLIVGVLSLAAITAVAVTHGELDNGRHPYVGLMVALGADGHPLWRCSGTMLSDTIFLTAGHCTEAPAARAEIWFADGPIPVAPGYPAAGVNPCAGITGYPCTGDAHGTPQTHPQYDPNAFFLHDLGVVELASPFVRSTYGTLPGLNQLDDLAVRRGQHDNTFTAVGYGLQQSFPDAASWKDSAIRVRMLATPYLIQINGGLVGDYSLLLSNNAYSGGTCFGDSGGPNFIGSGRTESHVIAGVTSFGLNGNCAGTGGVYRIDKADDLNWLATFGVTP
jgi:Trypsin